MMENLSAQDYDAYYRFMEKYVSNWSWGYADMNDDYKMIKQVGEVIPEYHFDKALNNEALKGKFVLLNFWATWCEGCRILSCDIDTMIQKNPSVYEGVQVIGVDAHEKMVDKGFKAKKWWAENISTYPAVYGKAADACCDFLRGGHPSAFLLDVRGVVCGRWDAWTSDVAEAITTAIWILKTVPEQNIQANLENVKRFMEQKEYLKALYLLEMMPDMAESSAYRYICMLNVGAFDKAVTYFKELQKKYEQDKSEENAYNWKPSREYVEIMKAIGEAVYNSGRGELEILKNGIYAMGICIDADVDNFIYFEKAGLLRIRYAESYRRSGIGLLKEALLRVNESGNNIEDKARIEKLLESYK